MKKNTLKKTFYYCLPILIHFAFLPAWVWGSIDNTLILNIYLSEYYMAAIATPIYLLIVYLIHDYRKKTSIPIRFFMILINTLGGLLCYFNCAMSVDVYYRLHPDSGTLMIILIVIVTANVILTLGLIIMSVIDIVKRKRDKKPEKET